MILVRAVVAAVTAALERACGPEPTRPVPHQARVRVWPGPYDWAAGDCEL